MKLRTMLATASRCSSVTWVPAAGTNVTAGPFERSSVRNVPTPGTSDRTNDVVTFHTDRWARNFAVFGTGPLHLLSTVRQVQSEGDWHSIPGFIGSELGLGRGVGHAIALILAVGFAAVLCWLVRQVWQGELDWVAAAGWAAVALLVSAASLLPWYVAWLMPFAALGRDRRLWNVAIVMTGVVQGIQLFGYIPHGASLLGL